MGALCKVTGGGRGEVWVGSVVGGGEEEGHEESRPCEATGGSDGVDVDTVGSIVARGDAVVDPDGIKLGGREGGRSGTPPLKKEELG